MSYAVAWSENGGPLYAGRLELADGCVLLTGTASQARESRRRVLHRELSEVRVERRPEARLGSRPTLVLQRGDRGCIRIASVGGPGALLELAERLSAAHGKAAA